MNRILTRAAVLSWLCFWLAAASGQSAESPKPPTVPTTDWPVISGDGVAQPLAAKGDAGRGRAVAFDRESACTLCHQLPSGQAAAPLASGGDLGPPLIGVGARWSAAQLRLRMIDSSRINPDTIMPGYFRLEGLRGVASGYTGRTILQAQQIEDLVAWLETLK